MKKTILLGCLLLALTLTACGKKEECKHQYEKIETAEVTCTTDGYSLYMCPLCEDSYKTDIVRAKGHQTFVSKEGVKATCEEPGWTDELSCSVCNQVVKQQEKLSVLGHFFGGWEEETKPTKDTTGLLVKTCKNDPTHREEKVLPKLSSTDYTVETTVATCTKEGLEVYTIQFEGKTYRYEVVLQKIPHTYSAKVTLPTCTEKGYTTHTCSCGDTYIDTYVTELGHKYTNYISNNDATCEEDGTKTASCDNKCGTLDTITDEGTAFDHDYESEVIAPKCEEVGYTKYTCKHDPTHTYIADYVDALEHEFTEYISNNDATCEEDGTKTAKCNHNCGKEDTITDEDTALGHDYESEVIAPKCEEAGYTKYTCKHDPTHTYIADYVDALEHEFTEYISNNDATCEEDGTKTAKCNHNCGKEDTITDEDTALGHDYESEVIAPKCEEQGYTLYVCKYDATHTYKDTYVTELGHSFTNYVSNDDATCQKDGTKTATCDNGCGKEDTVTDEGTKRGHDFITTVIAPTCEAQGYTISGCKYSDCTIKNEYSNFVDALGHKFFEEDYESDNNATCEEDGTKTAYCRNGCGKYDTIADEGSKLEHDYVHTVIAPTCYEIGYTLHECKNDSNHNYSDAYLPATGHNFNDYKTLHAATCENDRVVKSICANGCGEYDEKVEENTALGHKYGEWRVVTKPTEIATGQIKRVCDRNKDHIETIELPRLDPINYKLVAQDPTCTQNGRYEYTYTIDSQSFKFEIFKQATGHTIVDIKFDPTCTEKGYTLHTCHCGGYEVKDTYVDELGHDTFISIESYDPTCIYTGLTAEHTCRRCDKVITPSIVLAAPGHKDVDKDTYCDKCGVPVGTDVIKISTYAELLNIANNMAGKYQLVNDIKINTYTWQYIGDENTPFTGYFNGNGFKISGMKNATLFYKNEGTIDSLIIENATIETSASIDANSGTTEGVKGKFSFEYTKGILTTINNGTIKNCKLVGTTKLSHSAKLIFEGKSGHDREDTYNITMGGFTAINNGDIINCIVDGEVETTYSVEVKHTLNLVELNLGFWELPLQFYNDEHAYLTTNTYFGFYAGVNNETGKIEGCTINGKHISKYNLSASVGSNLARAWSTINSRVMAICGSNKGLISDVIVYQRSDVSRNVGENKKGSANTWETGYKNTLKEPEVQGYTYLIAENTGSIEDINIKYLTSK